MPSPSATPFLATSPIASEVPLPLLFPLDFAFFFLALLPFPLFGLLLQLLFGLRLEHLRLLQILIILPLGVSTTLAVLAVGTEAGEVERAQAIPLDVAVGAVRAERAEAAGEGRAQRAAVHRVDVQVQAVVGVGARLPARELGALALVAQVHLVLEVARRPLLAQPPHPVLADQPVERALAAAATAAVVLLRAARAQRAVALPVGLARRLLAVHAHLVLPFQEVVELEGEVGRVPRGVKHLVEQCCAVGPESHLIGWERELSTLRVMQWLRAVACVQLKPVGGMLSL